MTTINVYSPYDQHLIKEIKAIDDAGAEKMLSLAQQTFNNRQHWLKLYQRKEILTKTLAIVTEKKQEFALTAAEEGGKPLIDSKVEIERAISGIQIAIEYLGQMTGKEIAMRQNESSAHRMAFTFREPVGVVLAISAFNHPFNLIIHQVIPAIAVGCPVIVKPASATPLSCLNLVESLYEAGLPPMWCQMAPCNNKVAEQIATDSRINFLSFIGSSKVGWHLRSMLPPGATCALEHGGAAAVIIEADADLDDAVPLLVKGGFYHAGQVCVSVQRIFAQKKICKKLANQIAELAKKLIVGNPTDPKTEVGPLISSKEVDRIAEWVKEAVAGGAKLLCGGNKISNSCYEPTVLLNPPLTARVSKLEIFGPVVCIYSYDYLDQAIQQANALPFSFQSAIFTKNIDAALKAATQLEAVTVLINDHSAFRVDWMPFGGRKESGLGLGGIPYSMQEMTYEKMMVWRSPVL